MYKKIMVPLDGSELAECVLPHVEAIARACEVPEVTLVRVVEPFFPPATGGELPFSQEQIDQIDQANQQDALSYLKQVTERIKLQGGSVRTKMLVGKASESLADYAAKNNIELIIIATHGRSGVSRWIWGSMADRLLRSVCTPVLMVRAPGCGLLSAA